MSDPIDPVAQLERLADLRDRGVITPEEFEKQKAAILAAGTTTPPPTKADSRGCLILLLLPLLLIGGCFAYIKLAPGSTDYSSAVIAKCRESVRAQLKSPKSADFSNEVATESSTSGKLKTYRVTGKVDAENSFGASVRGRYSCTGSSTSGSFSDATASAKLIE